MQRALSYDDFLNEQQTAEIYQFLYASINGNLEEIKKYVKTGKSLEVTDKDGRTALILAALKNNHLVISYLIDCGANLQAEDNNGNNALYYCKLYDYSDSLKVLIEKGMEIQKNPELHRNNILKNKLDSSMSKPIKNSGIF